MSSDECLSIDRHGDPAESVLLRVAAGTSEAFTECLDRYGKLVWGLARRACRNRADAEDAAQDIFVALWRKAAQYDPARGRESTFIITLAQHMLIDRYRAGRWERLHVTLEDDAELPAPDHSRTAANHVDAVRAIAALNRIHPNQKRVIKLALWSGLSQTEISSLTGTPLGTVKAHMRRGFLAISQILQTTVVTPVSTADRRTLHPKMRNEQSRRTAISTRPAALAMKPVEKMLGDATWPQRPLNASPASAQI